MNEPFDINAELHGGCYCGALRYRVAAGWRLGVYACHCTICQTRSGAAFQLALPVRAKDFSVTGDVLEGSYALANGSLAKPCSCARCHTRTHVINSSRPDFLSIRAGTLDASDRVVPDVHFWTRSKQPWISIPEGALALETQPASEAEYLACFPGGRRT